MARVRLAISDDFKGIDPTNLVSYVIHIHLLLLYTYTISFAEYTTNCQTAKFHFIKIGCKYVNSLSYFKCNPTSNNPIVLFSYNRGVPFVFHSYI